MRSLNIQLPEPLYDGAAQAAASAGLSLEAFVLDAVQSRVEDDTGVPDSFFTPQIVAEIDAAIVEADKGGSLTVAETWEELAKFQESRLAKRRA